MNTAPPPSSQYKVIADTTEQWFYLKTHLYDARPCEQNFPKSWFALHCFCICLLKSHASHLAQLDTHSKENAEEICK